MFPDNLCLHNRAPGSRCTPRCNSFLAARGVRLLWELCEPCVTHQHWPSLDFEAPSRPGSTPPARIGSVGLTVPCALSLRARSRSSALTRLSAALGLTFVGALSPLTEGSRHSRTWASCGPFRRSQAPGSASCPWTTPSPTHPLPTWLPNTPSRALEAPADRVVTPPSGAGGDGNFLLRLGALVAAQRLRVMYRRNFVPVAATRAVGIFLLVARTSKP